MISAYLHHRYSLFRHHRPVSRYIVKCASALFTLLISGCGLLTTTPEQKPVKFSDLEGWSQEQAIGVRPALLNSCQRLNRSVLTEKSPWGSYQQWQSLCKELVQTPDRQLKAFFEQNFVPVRLSPQDRGLFTAYYSPVIPGNVTPSEEYSVPLLKLPHDLVKVRLADFGLSGQGLVGRVEKGFLKPYGSRAEIDQQTPKDSDVLLWLNSTVDKFFLQVQGSGNIELPDGKIIHVGYAGNNGHNYVAIGKILKQKGELEDVSMQTIQTWLEQNPDQKEWLLTQNPRYIFFSFSDEGAITAQGVPANSRRTLAVDPSYIPLGLPVWLDTRLTATGEKFQQMMVAQDTGSAIKGPARGDIYMGFGKDAALLAGPQQEPGKLYVLIPR
ncbi:murein transglycosylase A [Endozoicomonas elysicola]|uniref:murein transglycosylase A n=1 Tax=Endozoicomonas elysicola TaxID=305900 RepID=UPI00036EB433|nr:MltA domain-containing protein [Endozoicomonas elysicola]